MGMKYKKKAIKEMADELLREEEDRLRHSNAEFFAFFCGSVFLIIVLLFVWFC